MKKMRVLESISLTPRPRRYDSGPTTTVFTTILDPCSKYLISPIGRQVKETGTMVKVSSNDLTWFALDFITANLPLLTKRCPPG